MTTLNEDITVNTEQRKMMKVVLVILCCFGIYTYTVMFTEVVHYCDWTGEIIQDPIGHEVRFHFHNDTTTYYCCVNVSLLAFQELIDTGEVDELIDIDVRCPMCGMVMAWDDPMIVWVYSSDYLNPTTNEPTIVPLCEDIETSEMCESHFQDTYGGVVINNPYIWP
ncbi:MAG: hypothetical protein ACFE7R_02845 [Candidatus Hodarchaeota archaeon]